MQIDVDRLLAEAREMALELRLKDKAIAGLQARIAELEAAPVPDPAASAPESPDIPLSDT
jgi:hypothetical protein